MSKKTVVSPQFPQTEIGSPKKEFATEGLPLDKPIPKEEYLTAKELNKIRNKKPSVVSDQLCESLGGNSKIMCRNFKWDLQNKSYPMMRDLHMRFVTKAYPDIKKFKGPLLVDEPKTELEMLRMYEKQKVLKKLGFKHVVIEKDTTVFDCLEQLGET